DMKRRVEDETGEQKFYFANILDDLPYSLELAEQAAELGADGVLMSPFVQGLSIISEVARRTNLVILSHNSCGDVYNRVPGWGASHQVMALIQRAAGADLVVSPGPFATPWQADEEAQMFLAACRQPTGTWSQSMPIMQGGKKPEFLKDYVEACGSTDFMIIAATWVDEHAQGIQQGARAFREAWEQVQL
ncbi:MAG: RuBisCO large subunit C-terminal-like domain-containing protein, partial [Gammaproteobacteria bacterium]|nr:RuBisCO large subunit C-terminal-like domain-containing protein [Gammaproteobacteria bacterium]